MPEGAKVYLTKEFRERTRPLSISAQIDRLSRMNNSEIRLGSGNSYMDLQGKLTESIELYSSVNIDDWPQLKRVMRHMIVNYLAQTVGSQEMTLKLLGTGIASMVESFLAGEITEMQSLKHNQLYDDPISTEITDKIADIVMEVALEWEWL
jgi:hypothetical protein